MFELMTDGTLESPNAVIVAVVWSMILSYYAVGVARNYRQARQSSAWRRPLTQVNAVVHLAIMFVITPLAQFLIGNFLCQVEAFAARDASIPSIGLWGGPPILLSWIVAAICVGVSVSRDRKQEPASGGEL